MLPLQVPPGDVTVLAIAAHPDDVEIGCGGTLLTLCASRRVDSHVLVCSGTPMRKQEARRAAHEFWPGSPAVLHAYDLPDGRLPAHWEAVKDVLEDTATRVQPDIVLAPRRDDAHQDHRLLAELVPTVWRDALVLNYEIPKWDGDMGLATHYVPIDESTARRKVALLDACYPSQRSRDWWDEQVFLGLMRLRGMECRSRYAEAFVAAKVTVRT